MTDRRYVCSPRRPRMTVHPPGIIRAARNPVSVAMPQQTGLRMNTPQPFQFNPPNGRSIPMASHFRDITLGGGRNALRETLKSLGEAAGGYFFRHRLALYLLSVAAVALGFALSWDWLTAAALFPVVAVLPCAFMMFRCARNGTSRSSCLKQPGLILKSAQAI